MIWIARVLVALMIVGPFIGAFWPTPHSANATGFAFFGAPEFVLLRQTGLFALINTIYALAFCFILFSLALCRRSGAGPLGGLVLIVTLTFLVPVALKAFAFLHLFEDLFGMSSGRFLFATWTLTYGTIFLWATLLGFISSESQAAVVESISELARGLWRAVLLARAMAVPLFIGGLCTFVSMFFGGREVRILTLDTIPVGETISQLFGGRDREAAIVGLTVFLSLLGCVGLFWLLSRLWRRAPRSIDAVPAGITVRSL